MKQTIRFIIGRELFVLGVIFIVAPVFGENISGLYNTGVNNDGSLKATNTIDSHYSLVSAPAGAMQIAWVPSSIPTSYPFPGGWLVVSNARWLAPATNASLDEPRGGYDYRLTFNLVDVSSNALDPATAIITGNWAVDDSGVILLNGVPVATNSVGFTALTPFSISTAFLAGTNTLDFVVTNGNNPIPNPTGLLISGLSGTATLMRNEASLKIDLYAGIQINGTVGATYQLQYATLLPSTNWITLTNIVLPISPFLYFDADAISNNGKRFYRAFLVQ